MSGSLDKVLDLDLELAAGEHRAALRRLRHGRVTATAEVFDGRVIEHHVSVDHLTHSDLDRMIRERPRPAGKGERP